MRVFDELYHHPVEDEQGYDARWVLTRRPVVVAGGELTLDELDDCIGAASIHLTDQQNRWLDLRED